MLAKYTSAPAPGNTGVMLHTNSNAEIEHVSGSVYLVFWTNYITWDRENHSFFQKYIHTEIFPESH